MASHEIKFLNSLTPEDRVTMFIEWCALSGFGLHGWPQGAADQLKAHIRQATDAARAEEHNFLLSAIAIINWMSGSEDFGPGGKAHNGWLHWQSALEAIRARAREASDG